MLVKTITPFLLFCAMFVLFHSQLCAQCICAGCPQPIPDDNTRNYILRVDSAQNNDLGSPNQGVCQVTLSFQHSFVGDLSISLSSPSGQVVNLIGPAPTTLSGQTDFSSWDVRFVPCGQSAFPDPGFPTGWTNTVNWGFFQNFTGSYHPHSGCLEDFDSGPVVGLWTLSISDKSQMDAGLLTDFDISFCDESDLECVPCQAHPGQISPDSLFYCSGDSATNASISPALTFPSGFPDSAEYHTTLVIAKNDTIIDYADSLLLGGATPGVYQLCGFSYALEDSALLPKPSNHHLLSALKEDLFGTIPSFCGSLSDSCMTVVLASTPDPIDTIVTLCAGETTIFADSMLKQTGVYEFDLLNSEGCDSFVRVQLTILDTLLSTLDTTICSGQNIQIGNQLFDQQGNYRVTLPNASQTGCDSTIVVSLTVVDPIAIVSTPDPLTCVRDTVLLNGIASQTDSFIAFSWKSLSGTPDPIPTHTPVASVSEAGLYQLTVSYPNPGFPQCADSTQVLVSIDTTPPHLLVTISDSVISCLVTEITLDASPSLPADSLNFLWKGLNGFQYTVPSLLVSEPGIYRLQVSRTDNGCIDSALITIEADTSLPVVTAQSTTITCIHPLAELTGTILPAFASGIWTGPQSFTSTSPDTFTSLAGTYILTATLSNGCSASASTEVTPDTIAPQLTLAAETISCADTLAVLYAQSEPGADSFFWQGPQQFTANTLEALTPHPGLYVFTAKSSNGCLSTDSVLVPADTMAPPLQASADTLTCRDTIVWLTGQSSPGTILVWNGHPPGDSLMVTDPGTFALMATGINGCSQSLTITVEQDTFAPPLFILPPDTLTCKNPTATLVETTGNNTKIQLSWIFPDGQVVIDSESIVVTTPGVYITEALFENGCLSTDTLSVLVDTLSPDAAIASSGNLTCTIPEVTLDGTLSSGAHDLSFQWLFFNSPFSTKESVNVIQGGTYKLIITDTINGCKDSAHIQVEQDTIAPSIQWNTPDTITCLLPKIVIQPSDSVIPGNLFFEWTSLGAFIESGSQTPEPVVSSPGMIAVTVSHPTNGCMSKDTFTIWADTVAPLVSLGPDIVSQCEDDPLQIEGVFTPGVAISWVAVEGEILEGSESPNPLVTRPGIYIATAQSASNGCSASDTIEIIQSVFLEEAALDDSLKVCWSEPVFISGNLPLGPITGRWSSPTGASISDPTAATTAILSNPPLATHLVVWTLSSTECPDYDADTLILLSSLPPDLSDDIFIIPTGSSMADIPILANDQIPFLPVPSILSEPNHGMVLLGSDNSALYSSNPGFCGTDYFSYSVCTPECPNQCDTAIVRVEITPTALLDPDGIPNAITPNGDGNNDLFVIEFLENGNCGNRPEPELVILNRWGDVVYSAKPYKNDWGGQGSDGSMLPQGTYYYILKLDVANGLILKGDITILR